MNKKFTIIFLFIFFVAFYYLDSKSNLMFYNINYENRRTDNYNLQSSINQRNFTINADPPNNEDWKPTDNPAYPIKPDDYGIDLDGCYVSHCWNESIDPSINRYPSIHWERNFSLLIGDVSYFNITSASVNAIINATVHANNGAIAGVDCPGDIVDQGAVFDYVRFYIIISDLNKFNVFQIAYLQTIDLGKDIAGEYDFLLNTYVDTVPQEALIFYLGNVLEIGEYEFTVAMGIDIHCENNYILNDTDYWDILRIKSFNLTFSYEYQPIKEDTKARIEGYNLVFLISIACIISIAYTMQIKKKSAGVIG